MPLRTVNLNAKCKCPGPATRRDFLKVGVITGLGLTLGDYFRLQKATAEAQEAAPTPEAPAAPPGPPAESVIYIFLAGGLSHLDSFDPKPNAPLEYRGELGAVATNTGEEFGGLVQRLAQKADKLTVIRSLTHTEAAHERGTHNMLTEVDAHFKSMEHSGLLSAMDGNYQRAYALISSQAAREAFAIDQEPAEIRDEYGRHEPGQQLLLARRLVEGGARFVTVVNGGWDHHKNIKGSLQNQLPPVDQALAALITDLERRGRLDKTLVVLASEFGRTVRLNPDGGRDHWPRAFSVVLAGGGIKPGLIYGKTDTYGSEPVENPVHPEDVAATILTQLGINPKKKLMSDGNRPIDIVRRGEVIQALLA